MSWEPELEELRRREEFARRMGGEERVARQHASGRLTVRERIERLVDAGSFHETGALAGRGSYDERGELSDFVPANTVVGQGRIDGRRAAVQGDDFTIRGGAADAAIWEKAVYAERLAHDLRIPLVRLVDGTGGGGSVKTLEQMGFSYGPPVVAMAGMGEAPDKEELGGARLQARAGGVDNVAQDEDDALDQLRRYLAYLPANVWEAPPVAPASDPAERRAEELVSIVPRDPRRPYKMRAILERVLDRGSIFELGAAFGRPTITCLARLGGRPVGVIASDPEHYGGGVTGDAADKTARFVDVCDQFHMPVVNFVDVPGFVIGSAAERAGTIRRGARGLFAVMQASVPWVSILVRKVYGVAGAGHGDGSRLNLRFAWPSGNWGSLPMAGGLEAAYRRELEAADDPAALRAEIAARLEAVTSPFRTAERFSVEEIIDPRDTRHILCDWAERAHELVRHELHAGPKARGVRP
jgi:acetyl-CoA carboxylase carboxyltransferase component